MGEKARDNDPERESERGGDREKIYKKRNKNIEREFLEKLWTPKYHNHTVKL